MPSHNTSSGVSASGGIMRSSASGAAVRSSTSRNRATAPRQRNARRATDQKPHPNARQRSCGMRRQHPALKQPRARGQHRQRPRQQIGRNPAAARRQLSQQNQRRQRQRHAQIAAHGRKTPRHARFRTGSSARGRRAMDICQSLFTARPRKAKKRIGPGKARTGNAQRHFARESWQDIQKPVVTNCRMIWLRIPYIQAI